MKNLIFLATQTFEEFNKTGADEIFVFASQSDPIFAPMILFTIFTSIFILVLYLNERFSSKPEFIVAGTSASFVTYISALLMRLKDGIIPPYVLTITFTILLIFAFLLIFWKNRN